MTKAADMGVVVGKSYRLKAGNDEGWPEDTVVTFKRDDGSNCPAFFCPESLDSDGWRYIYLHDLKQGEVEAPTATTFSFTVSETQTDIIIGKPLTAVELAKVLEAAGVK